jgi:hypothetical protein
MKPDGPPERPSAEEMAGAREYLRRAIDSLMPFGPPPPFARRTSLTGFLWDRLNLDGGPRKGPLVLPDREP